LSMNRRLAKDSAFAAAMHSDCAGETSVCVTRRRPPPPT
jgi:hypothetical protein